MDIDLSSIRDTPKKKEKKSHFKILCVLYSSHLYEVKKSYFLHRILLYVGLEPTATSKKACALPTELVQHSTL